VSCPPPSCTPYPPPQRDLIDQCLPPDQPHRRAQWQSHLGWDDVPNVNESRRHSLADIPTRRGSFAADEPLNIMGCGFSKHRSQHEATGSRQDTAGKVNFTASQPSSPFCRVHRSYFTLQTNQFQYHYKSSNQSSQGSSQHQNLWIAGHCFQTLFAVTHLGTTPETSALAKGSCAAQQAMQLRLCRVTTSHLTLRS